MQVCRRKPPRDRSSSRTAATGRSRDGRIGVGDGDRGERLPTSPRIRDRSQGECMRACCTSFTSASTAGGHVELGWPLLLARLRACDCHEGRGVVDGQSKVSRSMRRALLRSTGQGRACRPVDAARAAALHWSGQGRAGHAACVVHGPWASLGRPARFHRLHSP